jgi:uncharacterized protein (TIGR03437 family)
MSKKNNALLSRRDSMKLIGAAGATSFLGFNENPIIPGFNPAKIPDNKFVESLLQPSLFAASPVQILKPITEMSCVGRPALTEGPFFVDERLNRSDIRPDPSNGIVSAGTKLTVKFIIYRSSSSTCTPLAGALVDLWHCDAAGGYSDVSGAGNPNNLGKKFLRGYQITDANGAVEFTTIYPGWYSGRTVHMHYKIRLFDGTTRTYDFTSQVCFDDGLTDTVFLQSPYSSKGNRSTRNNNDGIAQQGGSGILLNCVADGSGGYSTSYEVALTGLPATTSAMTTVSGASYAAGGALSSEGIASIFGNGIASTTQAATSLPLPTTLGDTTVSVRDSSNTTRNASIFYISPTQINVRIPTGTANGMATLTAQQSGTSVASGNVTIAPVSPGLFAANADASGVVAGYIQRIKNNISTEEPILNYDANAKRFVAKSVDMSSTTDKIYLILFGTGIRNRTSLSGVTCDIGGVPVTVEYAGLQGFYEGLDQLNLLLPNSLAGKGEVNINLKVDAVAANTVTVKFA